MFPGRRTVTPGPHVAEIGHIITRCMAVGILDRRRRAKGYDIHMTRRSWIEHRNPIMTRWKYQPVRATGPGTRQRGGVRQCYSYVNGHDAVATVQGGHRHVVCLSAVVIAPLIEVDLLDFLRPIRHVVAIVL